MVTRPVLTNGQTNDGQKHNAFADSVGRRGRKNIYVFLRWAHNMSDVWAQVVT